jgi:hypothetical protein
MKYRDASGRHRVKVLMGDRVSPFYQPLEQFAPAVVPRVQGVHARPDIDPQSVEVRPDRAGVGVASGEAPVPDEFLPHESSDMCRQERNNVIDAFRMEVPAEALEV